MRATRLHLAMAFLFALFSRIKEYFMPTEQETSRPSSGELDLAESIEDVLKEAFPHRKLRICVMHKGNMYQRVPPDFLEELTARIVQRDD